MPETTEPRSEVVVWSGRPDPRAVFTEWDVFWIPFGLFWSWSVVSSSADAPNVAGVLAAILGFYLSVGRLPVKVWVKSQTRYVITEAKAQVVGPRGTHTFDLTSGVTSIQRQRRGGRLTITFTSDPSPVSALASFREGFENVGIDFVLKPGKDIPFRFYDVPIEQALDASLNHIEAHSVE